MPLSSYGLEFDGALLRRGFWLYVWRITCGGRTVLYVGRTGDSSSPNASSPFRRIGQHLDPRANSKSTALARQLKAVGISPESCRFEMIAIGPVFPEQKEMERHLELRNKAGALERALADHLRKAGHDVLGGHSRVADCDDNLCSEFCRNADDRLGVPRPAGSRGVRHRR